MSVVSKLYKIIAVSVLVYSSLAFPQTFRDFRIHDRGMLHETVFNTGEIGRAWQTGQQGNATSVPVFEWPSRSATVVEGLQYSGQHNMLGAGMYIAANVAGNPGKSNRLYALCGGVGASDPEVANGLWSFPISIEEVENFPLLPDGSLNPDYNPDEAEEIITAKWATPLGITITRVSRAWSYPDYDDLIIYEYTLEYTGDTDGDPSTIEQTAQYRDFMALFIYGHAPSMYGYQRHYQEWKYDGGIYRGDQNGFWDADYWLTFNMDRRTSGDGGLMGKPEPNKELFRLFSETGINGGGLCSPQAPGYAMLHYDVNHLAIVDPDDPSRNESEAADILRTFNDEFYEIDENSHILQPWSNKVSTGNTRSSKMTVESINPDKRWSGRYAPNSTTWPEPPSARWLGRASYNYRQSVDAGQKHIVFGPYTLEHGDKLEYALAEVVGYGGQANKRVEGGQTLTQWSNIPSLDRRIVLDGEVMTENYLTDYGYPDYVNSDVVNVQQVAHKAFQAYLGEEPTLPVWPEDNPRDGSYKIPVPFPAPEYQIDNTEKAEVRLIWPRDLEEFTHPRLMGELSEFRIYRSLAGMGPWTQIGTLSKGEVNGDNVYEFLDDDPDFKVGERRYYSVTSVDVNGNQSGRTNIIEFQKNIGSVETFGAIHAVPNPFRVNSGFEGGGETTGQIGFYGLPSRCTIRIFSYAGQLVETIEHDQPIYSVAWFQVTRNRQEIASGIYFYVVTTPEGEQTTGKFVVIK